MNERNLTIVFMGLTFANLEDDLFKYSHLRPRTHLPTNIQKGKLQRLSLSQTQSQNFVLFDPHVQQIGTLTTFTLCKLFMIIIIVVCLQ